MTCSFGKLFKSIWTIDMVEMSFCLRIANAPLQFEIYSLVRTDQFINSSVPSTGERWTQYSSVIAGIDFIWLDDYWRSTSLMWMTVLTTTECVDYGSCSWKSQAIVRCPRMRLLIMSGFPHLWIILWLKISHFDENVFYKVFLTNREWSVISITGNMK